MKKTGKRSVISTEEILSKIFYTNNIANYIKQNIDYLETPTLSEHLKELCAQKGIKPKEVAKNAYINRFFGAKIFSGERNPSRDYVIRLAFGFGLSYDECQRLLKIACKNELYPRVPRDATIIYCLHNQFTYQETEHLLYNMKLPTLEDNKSGKSPKVEKDLSPNC